MRRSAAAADLIDLAHTCGARVLYFDSDVFFAEEFAVLYSDGLEHEAGVEDQLSVEAHNELKRLRHAVRTAPGRSRSWGCVLWPRACPTTAPAWHADLQDAWTEFTEQYRLSAAERAQDARVRADAEAELIAAELADNPEFRAVTKRSHHHDLGDPDRRMVRARSRADTCVWQLPARPAGVG